MAILSSLLLIGCAGDDASYGGTPDLGAQGSDMSAHTDGAFCTSIVNISSNPGPDTPGGFIFAPTDLIATAIPNTGNLEPPVWNVSTADGSTFTPEVIDQQSGLTVRFHAPISGSYTFRVIFPNANCQGLSSVTVHTRNSKSAIYKLRISPPTPAGIPQQDQTIVVYGDSPRGDLDLPLVQGTLLQSTLRGPGNTPIAGEVRLLGDSGPDALAVAGANGAFVVAVNNDLHYTPLLIPQGSTLAPGLLLAATGAQLSGASFTVDAGQSVSGTVRDPADVAIAGARVVLRSGKLPSGLGISAANGSYLLRAQPGSYSASVGADGWPELLLPSVNVPSSAQSLDVKYLVTRVAVSAKVVTSNGSAVGGARVTLRSPSLAGAATLTVGGVAQAANGHVQLVVVSGADGTLPPLLLPPLATGQYDVLIEPPSGATDGVTSQLEPLTGAASWTLTLQPKITLKGMVTNLLGVGVANVKVTAFETAGLGAAPAARSDTDGSWSLRVDPGSPLEMLFEPPGSANLSSARLPLAAGSTQATAALAPGLKIGGYVTFGGAKLPSVVVDALCSDCGSPIPIASAISDGSGVYSLYLPDPGLEQLDGGVVDLSP